MKNELPIEKAKMKILFVLNTAGLGGANRSLLTLMKFLLEKSVALYALIPNNGPVEDKLKEVGCRYIICPYRGCMLTPGYIGAPWLVNLFYTIHLVRKVRKWDVDIVHTNSSTHDIGYTLAKILRKKHIWHIRESIENHFHASYALPRLYRRKRVRADATICVSQFIYTINKNKFPGRNMQVIYNPFVVDDYYYDRSEFAPNSKIMILVAGNISDSKGQLEAIKAIKLLVDEKNYNFQLKIVGDGDKNAVLEIKKYIAENGLNAYIDIMPFKEDLDQLRKMSDIALNCSVYEALPRVTIEGMLSGLLAIGNNTGGTAEIIKDGITGLLYESGDVIQLAQKLKYAQEHKGQCHNIILNAQQYAKSKFDYRKNGQEIYDLYTAVMERG